MGERRGRNRAGKQTLTTEKTDPKNYNLITILNIIDIAKESADKRHTFQPETKELNSMLNFLAIAAMASVASASGAYAETQPHLTVYSSYDGERLAPVFAPFTASTGIPVKVVYEGSDALLTKLKSEGADSPADIYLDKDLVFLGEAKRAGLLTPFVSKTLEKNIPVNLMERDSNWFTLFYRARVIVYDRETVKEEQLSTYEALASDKWRGQLCLRTSTSSYNQALISALLLKNGADSALATINGWAANLALAPFTSDTDLIKAIAEGKCSVGIVNTYYLATFLKKDPAFRVRPFFPNQGSTGAHVNGVGIGLTRSGKQKEMATKLLEYMSSATVQEAIASGFSQYPANPNAPLAKVLVESFGRFEQDRTPQQEISDAVERANAIIERSDYR